MYKTAIFGRAPNIATCYQRTFRCHISCQLWSRWHDAKGDYFGTRTGRSGWKSRSQLASICICKDRSTRVTISQKYTSSIATPVDCIDRILEHTLGIQVRYSFKEIQCHAEAVVVRTVRRNARRVIVIRYANRLRHLRSSLHSNCRHGTRGTSPCPLRKP